VEEEMFKLPVYQKLQELYPQNPRPCFYGYPINFINPRSWRMRARNLLSISRLSLSLSLAGGGGDVQAPGVPEAAITLPETFHSIPLL